MADEIEKTSPLSFGIKSPIDFSKVNPVGVGEHPHITSAYERMLKSQEDLANQLEQRYEKPNLWNIAAAFAKPQLGGFMASLGSAAQELGKNVEAQRAIAPTIARMRAEVAAGQLPLAQRVAQKEAHDAWKAKGMPVNEVQDIIKLDETSPLAKALKDQYGAASTEAGTRSTNVNTEITGQRAVAEDPYLILKDPIFKGTIAEPKPEQVAGYLERLAAARPKDIPAEQWNAMGVAEKQNAVAAYAREQTTAGMNEEQKSSLAARGADNLLNDLTYLRTLAIDPKLAPMFSLFKNGDAISMFRSFLDKNPGNTQAAVEGLTAAAMDQLKNADEQTRAKADKFVKGLARLEVNLRGSNVNPTDAFQQLNTMQSPNLGNSQSGFVGIIDQMGLQAKHDLDRHNLRVESNVPARRMLTSPEARALENQYRDEAAELAKANALKATPSWYKPQASAQSVANSANSAAAAQAGSMSERLRAIQAARAQQRTQQNAQTTTP